MSELNSWPLQPDAQQRWEAVLDETAVVAGELAVADQAEQPVVLEEVHTTRYFRHPAPTPGDAPRLKNPTPEERASEQRPMRVAAPLRRGPVVPRGLRR